MALLAGALLLVAVEVGAKDDFPVPTGLAPAVRFWVDMFTRYGQQDVVLHDRYELGRVYEVVHLAGGDAAGEVAARVQAISDRFRSPVVLARAAGDPLFVEPPDVVRDADRVRAQRGMREDVVAALASARLYGPVVERALAHEGLPVELTALPLFESSYHPEAVSSGGAVGLWQLTRATGQQYLRVDDEVDERRDPERASAAAAAHLRELRGALPNWPLAITAYNHGLGGVARARRQIGSDNLGEVVMNYSGPGFGFASRNYYAEFRAALEVMRHANRYFPELSTARVIEVRVKPGDTLATLARRHGVSVPSIRAANGLNSTLLQPGRLLLVRL